LRPLYYDWPEAEQAYSAKNEYLFGDSMIVAPVASPLDNSNGLAAVSLWLPPGDWIEWHTGKHFTGPIEIARTFSLREIPVYVRAGAILPMAPKMRYTNEKAVDPLIVTVFPLAAGQKTSYTLYEDAGDTRAYESGEAATTQLRAFQDGTDLTVE